MQEQEMKLISGIWMSGLAKHASLNNKVLCRIFEYSKSINQLFELNPKTILELIQGPPSKVIKAKNYLYNNSGKRRVMDIGKLKYRQGMRVLEITDNNYPGRLREISAAPPLIYYRGREAIKILNSGYFVSVIGTRNPTPYGEAVTKMTVSELVKRDITIVSGMARGIDSLAHKKTIEEEGKTIAVLGCGADIVYPPENRELMENIIKNGCVISELLPGTPPVRSYFPARNRIISGLSDCVTVMEASKKSGTMITAGYAAEQGKDLFAVPGSVFSPESAGTNSLIQEGAGVLTCVDDMLWRYEFKIEKPESSDNVNIKNSHNIEKILSQEEKTIEEVALMLEKPMDKTAQILSEYEQSGKVIFKNGRFSLTDSDK